MILQLLSLKTGVLEIQVEIWSPLSVLQCISTTVVLSDFKQLNLTILSSLLVPADVKVKLTPVHNQLLAAV